MAVESIHMDPTAPAAALAAALNSQEQFGQAMQLQQQQQQQALAAGQDGRTGAAAPTAAAAAAGQPAVVDLATLQQMFAGFTQQASTELQSQVDARLAQLTAQLTARTSRRKRAPAAAAAAETRAAAAADAMEADGAGAEEPSSGSSSDDDELPPAKGVLNTPPEILVARKNKDLRVMSERELFVQSWAGEYKTFYSNQQAASMSAVQLVADWRKREDGYMAMHD
ncbi:hypothetical protein PLESTM_001083900 [Pleodorina starrii]|nr:hypothetical protein PLESTM_001083900 [Pleodorina starrii]